MPKKLEEKLKKEAKAKGLKGKRYNAYVYGTLAKIKKRGKKCIIAFVCLIIGILIIPVAGSSNYGIVNDSELHTDTASYSISGGISSNNQIDTIIIPHIEYLSLVYSVQYFANDVVSKSGGSPIPDSGVYVSTNNTEPLPIWVNDSFNRIVGVGDILWSVDNSNDIVLAMSFSSWDIHNLTGAQHLTVNWLNSADKNKIYFITYSGGGYKGPEDNSYIYGFSIEFWARSYAFPANTRVVYFSNNFEVEYTRTPGVVSDIISVNHTSSKYPNAFSAHVQMYSQNLTGDWTKVYDTTGIVDDYWSFPAGSGENLTIINPVTSKQFSFDWNVLGGSGTNQHIIVYTRDASTSQLLGGTTITIHNTTTSANTYTGTASNGILYYTLPVGNSYSISGAKTGYATATNGLSIAVYDLNPISITLNMYPSAAGIAGNGTQAFITEYEYTPYQFDYVSGAGITISNATLGDTQTKFTNSQGYVAFIINNSYDYTYAASKSGYAGATGTFNMGGASTNTLTLIMNAPITAIATPTLTQATGESATADISQIFYDAGPTIAGLVIIVIIVGLFGLMTGEGRKRRSKY